MLHAESPVVHVEFSCILHAKQFILYFTIPTHRNTIESVGFYLLLHLYNMQSMARPISNPRAIPTMIANATPAESKIVAIYVKITQEQTHMVEIWKNSATNSIGDA